MTTPFITTGVPTTSGPGGPVPVRREIRELQKNDPVQFNLFLLGLSALHNTNESDGTSYYQISGIHGVPYKAWNDVTGVEGQQSGYCTHSSILFLPWHRPYLALFEQVLHQKMQGIAQAFTPSLKSQYVTAAENFRLPYWDWGLVATGKNAFPSSMSGPSNVQVTGIDGKKQTIPNPLHHYGINSDILNSGDFPDAPYNTWATTHRFPQNSDPDTLSQDGMVNSAIGSQNKNIREMLRYVMGSIKEFGPFSNDKWIPGQPGAYASLEDIHDNIHVLVGGPGPSDQSLPSGHMSIVPYAAFDPAFWLHHCNVDRLFAIWQVLHPDTYVEPEPSPGGTFTKAPGTTEDIGSDLTPFWSNSSNFHSPASARETTSFGYAYPETQSWNFKTNQQYQQSVRSTVNKLYGTTLPVSGVANGASSGNPILTRDLESHDNVKIFGARPIDSQPVESGKHLGMSEKLRSVLPGKNTPIHDGKDGSAVEHREVTFNGHPNIDTSRIAPNGKYREWMTNLRVKKHCLSGTFSIHIFLGSVPADIKTWVTHENNVGTSSVLGSNPAATNCEKCKTDAARDLFVTGVIPLTEVLLVATAKGELRSLEPNDVVPYLTKVLHWRVTQADGTEKPREEVDGLQVSVVSTAATAASSEEEFPTYSGQWTLHAACTEGRPAGYGDGDQY